MGHGSNVLHSPYGAYELKALYQRNLSLAMLLVLTFVLTLLGLAWLLAPTSPKKVVSGLKPIISSVDLPLPPRVTTDVPRPRIQEPTLEVSTGSIPIAVPDDELADDEGMLLSRAELADLERRPVLPVIDEPAVILEEPEKTYPGIEDWVGAEIPPKLIHEVKPTYPRIAQQVGLEGTLHIKALVDTDGTVKEAVVYVSSGVAVLDQAALEAAYKNKFRPAVQNGNPVAIWVTYKVKFELDS